MNIRIIKPGIFTSIQDLGRTKYRSLGIGPGGAMDFFAASVANYIAGNDENAPVIEMHFPAAEIHFETDTLICITGANFDAHIYHEPVEMYKPVIIQEGSVLSFKKNISGARAYLAINGGMVAEKWLNSYSTNIKAQAGGRHGRPLAKDDSIEIHEQLPSINHKYFFIEPKLIHSVYNNKNTIRCIEGPEWELITAQGKENFLKDEFIVTSQSDRMGYRLFGTSISLNNSLNLVSSPVNFGTVQLLPNEQLIILMADHQTTGGYPRVANVITADLPRLAQASINTRLNFELVSLQEPEDALISLQHQLASIKTTCKKLYGDN